MSCRSARRSRGASRPPSADAGRAHGVRRTGQPADRPAARRREPAPMTPPERDPAVMRPPHPSLRLSQRRTAGRSAPAPERDDEDFPDRPSDQRDILDRLPVGVLVYRLDKLIYANKAFLDWTGYGRLDALADAGGLDALFVDPGVGATGTNGTKTLAISTQCGIAVPVDGAPVQHAVGGRDGAGADADHASPAPRGAARSASQPDPRRRGAARDPRRRRRRRAAGRPRRPHRLAQPPGPRAVRRRRRRIRSACRSPACSPRKASAPRSTC